MSRFDKLKRLKDEVIRLFHEGFDENAILTRLRIDEQFADANSGQVQAFYSHLKEKSYVEARDKRKIAEHEQQILGHQQRIADYEQRITEENQQIVEQQIAQHERELAKKQQMKTEIEFMSKYQQNASKFFICDGYHANWAAVKFFWQKRFLMTVEDCITASDVHTIKIQDLFQEVAKSFKVQKIGYFCDIHALKFPFALLHEVKTFNRVEYLRLAKFDFESEYLQIVQSFESNTGCEVLASATDASKFLLRRGDDVNECKLIGDRIQIGKKLVLNSDFKIDCGSYFDEQFCFLQFEISHDNQFGNYQLTRVKVLLHDLKQNEHSIRNLDSTPTNVNCFRIFGPSNFTWMRNTVFLTVEFPLTRNHAIIFTNPQVRNWKFVEFATDLKIGRIQSFADGSLMFCSEKEERHKREVYKLQMREPDSLCNMAWIAMIKLFNESKVNNPYEEARQYLPLNSEIQPFFSPTISKTSNSLFKFFSDVYHFLCSYW